jgi:serine/threonine protein kinase
MVAGDSPEGLGGLGPGSRVAGYLLDRQVGVGGMAVVYRALDENLGRVVALKVLSASLADDPAARERFVREARTVATVEHPHIIPVYAAGQDGGLLFIAMRFVAGPDLRTLIRMDGPLPVRRAAAFVSDMASALDAAHAVGVVHRDVKPANVLVDSQTGRREHSYLTDFGVARLQSVGSLTKAGQFVGTPNYAAPEQISGPSVDGRTDEYALACVAYELLTGSVPFRREEQLAVIYAHLQAPPPRATATRPDLPPSVDDVLARGLAKAPDDRYDNCGDFADALRDVLGLDPYDPRKPTGSTGTRSPGTGRKPASVTHPDPPNPKNPDRRSSSPDPTLDYTQTVPPPAALGVKAGGPQAPDAPDPGPARDAGSSPEAKPSPEARPAPNAQGPRKKSATPPVAVTWTAVVTADHAYYESMDAVDARDSATMSFPGYVPERRFRLSGAEVRIGRKSKTTGITPEIDLGVAPADPGISRLHAKLVPAPGNQGWTVVDLGTDNGIQVNGKEVPSGESVALRDGDSIHLGAWTRITIARA